MSKDSAQEAREQECRVRKLARELLVAQVSNECFIENSKDSLCQNAWELASLFEAQSEERWRKLL